MHQSRRIWYLRPKYSYSPTCNSTPSSPGRTTLKRIALFLLFTRLRWISSLPPPPPSLISRSTEPSSTLPPSHFLTLPSSACRLVITTPIELPADSEENNPPTNNLLRCSFRDSNASLLWDCPMLGTTPTNSSRDPLFLAFPLEYSSSSHSTQLSLLRVESSVRGRGERFLSLACSWLIALRFFLQAAMSHLMSFMRMSSRLCPQLACTRLRYHWKSNSHSRSLCSSSSISYDHSSAHRSRNYSSDSRLPSLPTPASQSQLKMLQALYSRSSRRDSLMAVQQHSSSGQSFISSKSLPRELGRGARKRGSLNQSISTTQMLASPINFYLGGVGREGSGRVGLVTGSVLIDWLMELYYLVLASLSQFLVRLSEDASLRVILMGQCS